MANLKYKHTAYTSAQWASLNPVIVENEIVIESDTKRTKIGNGISTYNQLEYADANSIGNSLGSIKPTDAAPTPARNGNYTFSIGGNKPEWLTAEAGITEVKAGDGVAVVYTAPSGYSYTHVDMSTDIEQVRSQATNKVPSSKLMDDELKINEGLTGKIQTTLPNGVLSPNFVSFTTGNLADGGGTFFSTRYEITGLRGFLYAKANISHSSIPAIGIYRNGVSAAVYKSEVASITNQEDYVELTDELNGDYLHVCYQLSVGVNQVPILYDSKIRELINKSKSPDLYITKPFRVVFTAKPEIYGYTANIIFAENSIFGLAGIKRNFKQYVSGTYTADIANKASRSWIALYIDYNNKTNSFGDIYCDTWSVNKTVSKSIETTTFVLYLLDDAANEVYNASINSISNKRLIDSLSTEIYNLQTEIKKPTSILWEQDLSESVVDIDGNFTQITNGVTINNIGEYISLNRFYSINKRLFRLIFTAKNGSFSIGRIELEGFLNTSFFLTFDIPGDLITLGVTTQAFSFVEDRKYIADVKLLNTTITLKITDYLTGDFVEVVSVGLTHFNDKIGVKLNSGTSPILHNLCVFSTTEPPYLLVVGDSITYGAGLPDNTNNRFAALIESKLSKPCLVSGRSGGNINGILGKYVGSNWIGKLFTEIEYLRPKYVMITIGTNGGNTAENLRYMVNTIRSFGCKVILNNVPCRAEGTIENHTDEAVSVKNTLIQQIRDELNISGCLLNVATSLNGDGYTTDLSLFLQEPYNSNFIWIHPNIDGHQKIYERTLIDVPELYLDAGVSII